jgi:hypothetical protein
MELFEQRVCPFGLPAGDDDLVSHLAELLRRLKPDPAPAAGACDKYNTHDLASFCCY